MKRFAQNLKPVGDRVTAQNILFEEQYESDLRNFPERATAFGDYRYNDKLAEYSLDAITKRHKTDAAFLTRLQAIPTAGFSDKDFLLRATQGFFRKGEFWKEELLAQLRRVINTSAGKPEGCTTQ